MTVHIKVVTHTSDTNIGREKAGGEAKSTIGEKEEYAVIATGHMTHRMLLHREKADLEVVVVKQQPIKNVYMLKNPK